MTGEEMIFDDRRIVAPDGTELSFEDSQAEIAAGSHQFSCKVYVLPEHELLIKLAFSLGDDVHLNEGFVGVVLEGFVKSVNEEMYGCVLANAQANHGPARVLVRTQQHNEQFSIFYILQEGEQIVQDSGETEDCDNDDPENENEIEMEEDDFHDSDVQFYLLQASSNEEGEEIVEDSGNDSDEKDYDYESANDDPENDYEHDDSDWNVALHMENRAVLPVPIMPHREYFNSITVGTPEIGENDYEYDDPENDYEHDDSDWDAAVHMENRAVLPVPIMPRAEYINNYTVGAPEIGENDYEYDDPENDYEHDDPDNDYEYDDSDVNVALHMENRAVLLVPIMSYAEYITSFTVGAPEIGDAEASEILGSPSEGIHCDSEAVCVICLDSLEDGSEDIKQLPCKHIFHYKCMLSSTKINNSCPVCRGKYDCRERQSC